MRFLNEFKEKLDSFKAKLTPELLDMYVQHYINRVPMGNFYNIVAPTSYIMALNNELRNIPKDIERPERPLVEYISQRYKRLSLYLVHLYYFVFKRLHG